LKTAPVMRASSFALSTFLPVIASVCPALEICVARAEPMLPEPISVTFMSYLRLVGFLRDRKSIRSRWRHYSSCWDVNKPPEWTLTVYS
jgi:hypothetical protein